MKKTLLTMLISGCATLVITLVIFEIIAQRDQIVTKNIEVIDSEFLNESRKVLVHLPKDYEENKLKKYPVLYALDATSHDHHLLNAANILSLADKMEEIIIVGIVNKDRNRDLTPHYLFADDEYKTLGKGDVFLNFLASEVMPVIENNYRTSKQRMLSGNSRAGLFTFYAMMEKPGLFDTYFCFSPAFWRGNNKIVGKVREHFNAPQATKTLLYLSLGSDENEKMKNGFNAMKNRLESEPPSELDFVFEFTKNANHSSNAYYSIPKALVLWQKWSQEH